MTFCLSGWKWSGKVERSHFRAFFFAHPCATVFYVAQQSGRACFLPHNHLDFKHTPCMCHHISHTMDACHLHDALAQRLKAPGKPLTVAERYKLVYDFSRLQSVAKVAAANNVDQRTVRRWVLAHKDTGTIARAPGSGRKRKLSDEAVSAARKLLLDGKHAGVKRVAEALHAEGKAPKVHRTTLSRNVRAQGVQLGKPIHVVRGEPERELSHATKTKRLQFAKADKHTNWDKVMFTDRKKFLWKYPGAQKKACYWVEKGKRPTVCKVNNPMAVNVYAGITKWGITKLHFVAGTSKMQTTHTTLKGKPARNITKSGYKEVLEETLLPEGSKLFHTLGLSGWVLQQDNDPCHKSANAVVNAWVQAHPGMHVSVLPGWPGNSPDLNPIENLWAWAQAKVDEHGCKTFDEFKHCVVHTLQNVPKQMLQNYVGSMKKRIAICIQRLGDKTGY